MTTLDKSTLLNTALRNVSKVEATKNVQGRQELATGGKIVPVSKPETAPSESVKRRGLDQALKSVSGHVQNISRELNFSVDEELNRSIVTVLDQETGEVIRQIPSEEMLEIAKHIDDFSSNGERPNSTGILFRGDA